MSETIPNPTYKERGGGGEIKSNLLLQSITVVLLYRQQAPAVKPAANVQTVGVPDYEEMVWLQVRISVCGKQLPERLSPAPRKTSYQACNFHGFSGSVNIIGMFNFVVLCRHQLLFQYRATRTQQPF